MPGFYPVKSHEFVAGRLSAALSRKTIPAVDFVRATAILFVVFYHAGWPVSGNLGVALFFILSGFLITSILLREECKTQTINLRNFYARRAYRIFPAFYVAILVYLLIEYKAKTLPPLWQVLTSIFYMNDYGRAFSTNQMDYFMGMSWSLAIEEKFYLIWPVVLLAFLVRKWSIARICRALCFVVLCIACFRTAILLKFGSGGAYVYNAFETRVDDLMCGAFLAVATSSPRLSRFITYPLRSAWMAIPTLVALGIINYAECHASAPAAWSLIYTLEGPLAALILLQGIYWGDTGLKFMRIAPVRHIARISYSLYLYHFIGLSLTPTWPHLPSHTLTALTRDSIGALYGVAIATVSYLLVEKPFLDLRARRTKAARLRQVPAPVS